MHATIAILPGDGAGVEVTREARLCLETIASAFGHTFDFQEFLIGGAALDQFQVPLPFATLDGCLASDAVLLGAVGTPKHDHQPPVLKPETGLLQLRAGLGVYANLRPVKLHPALIDASPLRPERVRGTDLLIVRELAGGLYFGEPRGRQEGRAWNTMVYSEAEVERVARAAFELARKRRKKVLSVDKANVLEASQLWREVVTRLGLEYPDVELNHGYVDSVAMALVTRPTDFDVILTENLFGDILSDEAAVLAGSLGLLPSASLGGKVGLFEPVHGSAPDIAGQDKVNPIGAILSAALLLRHSLNLEEEARALEAAVDGVLTEGYGTPDLHGARIAVGTTEMGQAIRTRIRVPVIQP